MKTSTRSIWVGKKFVQVTNVPTHFTDDQLRAYVLLKFYEINKKMVIQEITKSRKAS